MKTHAAAAWIDPRTDSGSISSKGNSLVVSQTAEERYRGQTLKASCQFVGSSEINAMIVKTVFSSSDSAIQAFAESNTASVIS
jgi:hypothetical protein